MSHVDHIAAFSADRPTLHASMKRASDNPPQLPEGKALAVKGSSGTGGDRNADNASFGTWVNAPSVVPDGARPALGYRRAVQ